MESWGFIYRVGASLKIVRYYTVSMWLIMFHPNVQIIQDGASKIAKLVYVSNFTKTCGYLSFAFGGKNENGQIY